MRASTVAVAIAATAFQTRRLLLSVEELELENVYINVYVNKLHHVERNIQSQNQVIVFN